MLALVKESARESGLAGLEGEREKEELVHDCGLHAPKECWMKRETRGNPISGSRLRPLQFIL